MLNEKKLEFNKTFQTVKVPKIGKRFALELFPILEIGEKKKKKDTWPMVSICDKIDHIWTSEDNMEERNGIEETHHVSVQHYCCFNCDTHV